MEAAVQMLESVTGAPWHVKAAVAVVAILASLLTGRFLNEFRLWRRLRPFPLVNPGLGPKGQIEFIYKAEEIIKKGAQEFNGQPFRVNDFSVTGSKLLLPPRYIDQLKNNPALDFGRSFGKDLYCDYPGFEPCNSGQKGMIFQDGIRRGLGPMIGVTITPLARELPNTLDMILGQPEDWKELRLQPTAFRIVSRLTALIFLGPAFMNNPEWQRIVTMYTADLLMACRRLNTIPKMLRPLVHWFLPECRKLRVYIKEAQALIHPEVERRLEEIRLNGGVARKRVLDSVDWFVASGQARPDMKEEFDIAVGEIAIAMAAVHTTERTIEYLLMDLLENPEYIQDLREEIITVLKENGKLDKTALFNLKKMDSVMRESMRIHSGGFTHMRRYAWEDIPLSDGKLIPKGTSIAIAPIPMLDEAIYPDPLKFDGYRSLRLRQAATTTEEKGQHQATTTSAEFLIFGHGLHACPGRAFAVNEIKLVMVHLLLQYEFQWPKEGARLPEIAAGFQPITNPAQIIMYRKRVPELDLADYYEEVVLEK